MSEWQELKLGDTINLKRGYDLPKRLRKKGKVPIYSSSGIFGYHNEEKVQPPGVVTGRYGTIGKVFLAQTAFWPLNTSLYVQDFKGNNEVFIYYFLKQINWEQFNDKSAVPGVNRNDVHQEDVSLPPLPEQKAIADVLSSLDDKIDLLHRQNETLEAMAQTLFRQWFVEEAGDDWEEKPLDDVVDIAIGRTPPRKEAHWFSTSPSDTAWMSIKDLGNKGIFVFDTSEYLTKEAIENFNIRIIPKNTVVLSFKMTVGRVGITTGAITSNEAIAHFKFRENTPFTTEYLYFFLKLFKYQELGSTSSIVTSINSRMIKAMEIPIPDDAIMNKFRNATTSLFRKIKKNQAQIHTLEKLRDTLLPKLVSGKVRVHFNEKKASA